MRRTVLGALVTSVSLLVLAAQPAIAPAKTLRAETVRSSGSIAALNAGILADVNAIRVQHGLVPLRLSAPLSSAAASHSRSMGTLGFFSHDSSGGSPFWKRIDRYYGSRGYGFWSVGENLLWASPDIAPAAALDLWMHSPEHRKNLLTARWREIGISSIHVAAAPGTFGGRAVTIVTTDFGVRR